MSLPKCMLMTFTDHSICLHRILSLPKLMKFFHHSSCFLFYEALHKSPYLKMKLNSELAYVNDFRFPF